MPSIRATSTLTPESIRPDVEQVVLHCAVPPPSTLQKTDKSSGTTAHAAYFRSPDSTKKSAQLLPRPHQIACPQTTNACSTCLPISPMHTFHQGCLYVTSSGSRAVLNPQFHMRSSIFAAVSLPCFSSPFTGIPAKKKKKRPGGLLRLQLLRAVSHLVILR